MIQKVSGTDSEKLGLDSLLTWASEMNLRTLKSRILKLERRIREADENTLGVFLNTAFIAWKQSGLLDSPQQDESMKALNAVLAGIEATTMNTLLKRIDKEIHSYYTRSERHTKVMLSFSLEAYDVSQVSRASFLYEKLLRHKRAIDSLLQDPLILRLHTEAIPTHYFNEPSAAETGIIWRVEIIFRNPNEDAAVISYILWSAATAISSIAGTTVEIEDWGRGSLWAKFKILVPDDAAQVRIQNMLQDTRDEVIRLGTKGLDAAEAQYIDKPIADVSRTKAETHKIDLESRKLEDEIERLAPKEFIEQRRALEIAEKQIEVDLKREQTEQLRLDNTLKKLEIVKQAAQLVASGILASKQVEIIINEHLFLSKNHDSIMAGEEMSVIASTALNHPGQSSATSDESSGE